MEDEILNLINAYNIRLNWLKGFDLSKFDDNYKVRILEKINCYKKFITELEMIINLKC